MKRRSRNDRRSSGVCHSARWMNQSVEVATSTRTAVPIHVEVWKDITYVLHLWEENSFMLPLLYLAWGIKRASCVCRIEVAMLLCRASYLYVRSYREVLWKNNVSIASVGGGKLRYHYTKRNNVCISIRSHFTLHGQAMYTASVRKKLRATYVLHH